MENKTDKIETVVETKQAIKESLSQLLIQERNIRNNINSLNQQLSTTVGCIELIVKTICSQCDVALEHGANFKFDKDLNVVLIFDRNGDNVVCGGCEMPSEVTNPEQLSDLLQVDSAEIIPLKE